MDLGERSGAGGLPAEPPPEAPALVVYTSGTTGPPKGAVLPRRAVASNLDALADAWAWSADDVLVHGLPLFHVHGLLLGTLGPVRLGSRLHHLGRFSPDAACAALAGGGTMLFGVPTMYGRLRREAEEDRDEETIGEVAVRGPNLMLEDLNRPDATAESVRDGWFHTGDVATVAPDGYVRIVGRRATDLIKSGGYKIGAGEIESALLEHLAVAEAAVTGEDDPDLGERVVAWVVAEGGSSPSARDLEDHVAGLLAPHKRPRTVRFLDELPRNDMGKVLKGELG